MERYEAYKDSGIDWIGKIPVGWSVCPIWSLATYNDETLPENTDETYSFRYIDIASVSEGSIDACSSQLFGSAPSRARRIIRRRDVLVSTVRTYLRAITLVDEEHDGDIASTGFCVLRPKADTNSRWFGYAVSENSIVEEVVARSVGVSYPAINATDLVKLQLRLPPIEEQRSIANYLDAKTAEIDALVTDCEREVELLQEYRKAVISEAVTKGLDPDVPMKDSGVEWIGDIPDHWDAGMLLRHARLESGHTPSRQHPEWWIEDECTIPWVTTHDVHRFRDGRITSIDDTELHVSQIGLDNSSARWLPAGTVALSRTASVGFSIVLSVPMASSQDFADWVPDETLDSYYLLYSLRSMDRVFKQLQMGSTHKTIYMPDIMKLAVAFPPLDEQKEIVSYLDAKTSEIDSLVDAKQAMAEKLREYRKSLISEAVTGKFKVPGV